MEICFYRGSVVERVSLNIVYFNCKDSPQKSDKYSLLNSIDYVDYLLFTVFLIYGSQIITMVETKGGEEREGRNKRK